MNWWRVAGVLCVLALLVLAGFFFRGSSRTEGDPLVGQWVGVADDGQQATIKFLRGNLFVAGVGEDSLSGRYEVRFEARPAQLDLVLEEAEPIQTIIEVLGDEKIRIQPTDPGAERPTRFTEEAILYSRAD